MNVAMLTPLPPTRTGVAHYASMILPALQEKVSVTAFDSTTYYRRGEYDAVIYQLGNNPHHEFAYREALANPGVAVLHDVVLHHLIVEMTLARGDADGYINALQRNHGDAGAAWARGRAAGLHSEMGNFLFPASIEVANRSRAVIVHNEYAAERLRSFGVATPIHVVGHPYVPQQIPAVRPNHHRVIGLFGFLTSAKRGEIVIEAFRRAYQRDRNLRLLIVGEPAPNIDMTMLSGEGVTVTGYVPDEEFDAWYAKADRLVNLRYPTAGETSGTLIRAFDAGRAVAVSNYAQFAELPDVCVTKIPLGEGEIEALEEFFAADLDETAIAKAQRNWLEKNARLETTVNGYLSALSTTPHSSVEPPTSAARIPLFPSLELLAATKSADRITIRIRNSGISKLRAREYGTPCYRMIAKLFANGTQIDDRWLDLPGDIEAGHEATIVFSTEKDASTLRLYHALESIPLLEPEPWASVELERV